MKKKENKQKDLVELSPEKRTRKVLLSVIFTMIIIYSLLFLIWNVTNTDPNNKPSHVIADMDREKYNSSNDLLKDMLRNREK